MRGEDRARLRWFPNRLPDGGNPYGIPLEDPTPPSMVLNLNHYATWPVGRDDGAQLIRDLLYHLRSTFVTMICIEGRDCDTLSDDQLHRMANGFCYGGATGRVAERLALAYDLCKCLRTHLSFDDVQSFMQTPDRRLDGKTPPAGARDVARCESAPSVATRHDKASRDWSRMLLLLSSASAGRRKRPSDGVVAAPGQSRVPLRRIPGSEEIVQDDVITQPTRAAHQAALDEHVRIKGYLSERGVSIDDFAIMDRYQLGDFDAAIERNGEA